MAENFGIVAKLLLRFNPNIFQSDSRDAGCRCWPLSVFMYPVRRPPIHHDDDGRQAIGTFLFSFSALDFAGKHKLGSWGWMGENGRLIKQLTTQSMQFLHPIHPSFRLFVCWSYTHCTCSSAVILGYKTMCSCVSHI